MTNEIQKRNDELRRNLFVQNDLGSIVLSDMVSSLSMEKQFELFSAVREFEDFTKDNDPYDEHDFGKVSCSGENYFFKIDYYDPTLTYHSEDKTNPKITKLVLTIMQSSEY